MFFAAMLHSQVVPQIVATMPQNWLGLGHAVFVQHSQCPMQVGLC